MIEILKLELAKLYVDENKKILHIDIISKKYDEQQFITLLDYLKNFWLLAYEAQNKYYMLIDLVNIGFYPLDVYTKIIDILHSLEQIFKKSLHCSCIVIESELTVNILKPILSVYKSVRPVTFINKYEEAIVFFAKSENNLTNV